MYKVIFELQIEGPNEGNINLKIRRNTACFKINNCFYHGYNWDEFEKSLYVSIFVNETDKKEAINHAYTELKKSNDIFLYLCGYLTISNFHLYNASQVELIDCAETKATSGNIKVVSDFMYSLSQLSEKERHLAEICMKFFARHLNMVVDELYDEALLNLVKSMELISNHNYKNEFQLTIESNFDTCFKKFIINSFEEEYRDADNDKVAYEKVQELMLGLVTLRRKIMLTFKHYNITRHAETIGKIISLRNSASAHGTTGRKEITIEDISKGYDLSKELIGKFILGETYSYSKVLFEVDIEN